MEKEEIILLRKAAEEIRLLRKTNEVQSARLSGFADAMVLVNARPQEYGNMARGEDVVYNIDKFLASLSS